MKNKKKAKRIINLIKIIKNRIITVILLFCILVLMLALNVYAQNKIINKQQTIIKMQTEEIILQEEIIKGLKEIKDTKKSYVNKKTVQNKNDDFIFYEIPKEYKNQGGDLPKDLQIYAFNLCIEYKFDYALLLAMIETESEYKQWAKSKAGAMGYMQIIPKYHKEKIKEFSRNETDITNPYLNIKVGLDYIASLQEKYGDMDKALTAYCFGEAGAKRYVWDKGLTSSDYSKKVLKRAIRIRTELGKIKEKREGVEK